MFGLVVIATIAVYLLVSLMVVLWARSWARKRSYSPSKAGWLAALAMYPDPVKKKLNLPDSKKIVLGLSLGYPDESSPVNQIKTDRESLENIVTWLDMDG